MTGPVRRAQLVRTAASIAASLLLLGVWVVVYTAHAQREADRRWCRTLAALDSPDAPATTPRGRRVQEEMQRLRTDFGCR
ncbi:hypothetical protein [Actinomadura flavalba]|uniref:hypothetical protein n=1 Tax=Actinomadura flavalba TaxID=1120938 RepID=UPI0003816CCA|nr:hypothetical protein [Actinomadura flavalba]